MNNDILIENIFGTSDVSHLTPALVLKNVGLQYLIVVNKSKPLVYSVDVTRLYKTLERKIKFIYQFTPIHQINGNTDKSYFTVLLANTEYFDMSASFTTLNKNVAIGTHKNGKKYGKTLGAIYQNTLLSSDASYPIFPESMLFRLESKKADTSTNDDPEGYVLLDQYSNSDGNIDLYQDVFYDSSDDRWGLKQRLFDTKGKHIRMISPSGDVSNLYVPKYV